MAVTVNARSTKIVCVVAVEGHTVTEQSFRNGEAPYDLECDANSAGVMLTPHTVTYLEQRN